MRLEIRGVIVGPEWDGDWAQKYIERGLLTPESRIRKQLASNAEAVDVYINSPGGSVFAAYEIVNALQQAAAAGRRVSVTVGAMAASAASMIAVMLGVPIRAHANAKFMFHSATSGLWGGPEALKDEAELLDRINAEVKTRLVTGYNLPPERVEDWFHEGPLGWLTAAEARDVGMVAEIIGEPAAVIAFPQADLADLSARGMKIAAYMEVPEDGRESGTPEQPAAVAGVDPAEDWDAELSAILGDSDAAYDEGERAGRDAGIATGKAERAELERQLAAVIVERDNARHELETATANHATAIAALETAHAEAVEIIMVERAAEIAVAANVRKGIEAKLAQLVNGGMAPPSDSAGPVVVDWATALAACGGDYVAARQKHPAVYRDFMARRRA